MDIGFGLFTRGQEEEIVAFSNEFSSVTPVIVTQLPALLLGCPKMTQLWKSPGIQADSGAKILVLMEIGQKKQIGEG